MKKDSFTLKLLNELEILLGELRSMELSNNKVSTVGLSCLLLLNRSGFISGYDYCILGERYGVFKFDCNEERNN